MVPLERKKVLAIRHRYVQMIHEKPPAPSHDFCWFWFVIRYPATYGLQIHDPQNHHPGTTTPNRPQARLPVGQSTQQSLLVLCFATSAKVYADITKPAGEAPELS